MNDRFKFRAWWKPNYRKPIMLYDVEKTYDYMHGEPESICADCFGEVLEDEDYIVMQCTGMKDKNGKLIYEGDIVRFQYGNGYRIGAVEVDKCDWRISNSNFCQGAWCGGALICLYETCEIIGNIYENKELLDGE